MRVKNPEKLVSPHGKLYFYNVARTIPLLITPAKIRIDFSVDSESIERHSIMSTPGKQMDFEGFSAEEAEDTEDTQPRKNVKRQCRDRPGMVQLSLQRHVGLVEALSGPWEQPFLSPHQSTLYPQWKIHKPPSHGAGRTLTISWSCVSPLAMGG